MNTLMKKMSFITRCALSVLPLLMLVNTSVDAQGAGSNIYVGSTANDFQVSNGDASYMSLFILIRLQ